MLRGARLHLRGGVYYLVSERSADRPPIFADATDYAALEGVFAKVLPSANAQVHAYYWTSHAIHLAVEVDELPTGRLMQKLMGRFARHVRSHRAPSERGAQERYRAVLIDPQAYLLPLVRYLHWLPVLEQRATHPSDYLWTSHRYYSRKDAATWLTLADTLTLLSPCVSQARRAYQRFVQTSPTPEDCRAFEDRKTIVLGDRTFCCRLPQDWPVHHCRMPLDQVVASVAMAFGVDPADLYAGKRAPQFALIRAVICWRAVELEVATLTEVAHRFQRSAPTLFYAIQRYRQSHPQFFRLDAFREAAPIVQLNRSLQHAPASTHTAHVHLPQRHASRAARPAQRSIRDGGSNGDRPARQAHPRMAVQ